ncbi:uncharacterized protein LOC110459833 [Mizuhopecten yessoensis]|uniref:Uncharacterized protein n=1 Tax=Mizuhopecten yessoensis TaxID=6573 RepID=A0A210Q3N8_MIZYE|nr:uncharacterized protein LOC110459833 [Mizuhopecten yessoensis]OWF43378.1 hypothetical protein KP79_PYT10054 [Mizuhopecten yessoensis]
MFGHIVLLFCVLTVASAQSPIRVRHYITVNANNNIHYGDRSHVQYRGNGLQPICKQLDRDLMIDKLLYDRITIEHSGSYHTAGGVVSGVGVEFQQVHESDQSFRTLLILVFRNEQEYTNFLTL